MFNAQCSMIFRNFAAVVLNHINSLISPLAICEEKEGKLFKRKKLISN